MNRDEHETIWASLDDIRVGERTVSSLSPATIDLYRMWLEEGLEAPPVWLARQGEGFVVRDGRHRIAAALAAGHRFIEAQVRPIARLRFRVGLDAFLRAASPAARTPGTRSGECLSLAPSRAWVRFPPSPSPLTGSGLHFEHERAEPALRHCRLASQEPREQEPGPSLSPEVEQSNSECECRSCFVVSHGFADSASPHRSGPNEALVFGARSPRKSHRRG